MARQEGVMGKMIRDAICNLLDKSAGRRVVSLLAQKLFEVLKTDGTHGRGGRG